MSMEDVLQNHNHWKTELDSTLDFLFDKFRKREEELKQAKHELETSKKAFESEMKAARAKFEKEVGERNKALEEARLQLETENKRMREVYQAQCSQVKLDIGGHMFSTSLTTLTRDKTSMLGAMFSGRHKLIKGKDDTYFIDRDGTHFRYILNYLRDDLSLDTLPEDVTTLKEIQREANYYQLSGLFDILQSIITPLPTLPDYNQEDIDCLLNKGTINNGPEHGNHKIMTKSRLDFKNKNLSSVSFVHTTFVHDVCFSGAMLKETNFYGCEFGSNVKVDFTNCDLTAADFRQCRAFAAALSTSGKTLKPPLYGTSCSTFLHLIQQ